VEDQLAGIPQVPVNAQAGVTFASALRALLRQDPDVMLVGEIRDGETAEIATQAALTGHLVLSTLHTNDAPSSLTRLVNIGLEPFLVGAAVRGVLAQRLVRTLCKQCKAPDETLSRENLNEVIKPWKINATGSYTPFKPVGCVDCRMTGFLGRMGLYELLTVTDACKDRINHQP